MEMSQKALQMVMSQMVMSQKSYTDGNVTEELFRW